MLSAKTAGSTLVTGHVPTHPFPEASPDPNLTLTQTLDLIQGRVGTWPATEQGPNGLTATAVWMEFSALFSNTAVAVARPTVSRRFADYVLDCLNLDSKNSSLDRLMFGPGVSPNVSGIYTRGFSLFRWLASPVVIYPWLVLSISDSPTWRTQPYTEMNWCLAFCRNTQKKGDVGVIFHSPKQCITLPRGQTIVGYRYTLTVQGDRDRKIRLFIWVSGFGYGTVFLTEIPRAEGTSPGGRRVGKGRGGGGGWEGILRVLRYVRHIGMCRSKGYHFEPF